METKKYAIIRLATNEDLKNEAIEITQHKGSDYVIHSIWRNRERLNRLAVISDDVCLAEVEETKHKIIKLLKIC